MPHSPANRGIADEAAHERDEVVLLDAEGRPCGRAPRRTVHGSDTPLHLAYSCWLLDTSGRVLITRRALGKRAWPGVWTNAFCGHPRPEESMEDAVRRGAQWELGVELDELAPILPDFAYRAVDALGVVENEVCPVHVGRTSKQVRPEPSEVMEYRWLSVDELRTAVRAAPWALSPWLLAQVAEIDARSLWAQLAVSGQS